MSELRNKFITGAAWMSSLRWALKLLGLINTAVLARLLTPDDFGLIAMAMLTIGFIEVWFGFGVETALIQNKHATRDDFDTAWTLRIIQGCCVALILLATSPYIADYFHDQRLPPVLWLLSGAIVIFSAGNIGTVNFQKQLDFKTEFIFTIIGKISGVVVTIALAYWINNYWALAIGIFFGYAFGFVISYIMHPYRPRLSLKKLRDLWKFSQWMMITNIGTFINRRADEFIVGNLAPAKSLGVYSISLDIGQTLTNELAQPINRVMLPLLSNIQDEIERLRGIYLKITSSVNTLTLPAGVGLALCAPQVVILILGQQWLEAIPYLQIFALYGALRFTYSGVNAVLISINHVRIVSILEWSEAVMLIGFCVAGGLQYGLIGIALGRLMVSLSIGGLAIYFVTKYTQITAFDFFQILWRPATSVIVMAGILTYWPPSQDLPPLLALAYQIPLGFVAYTTTLLSLWQLSGKPEGIEQTAIHTLRNFFVKQQT